MNFVSWLRNLKDGAPNYAARAGEPIKGNLGRAADGKFSAVGSGGSAKPAAKKPDAKAPVKPAPKKDAAAKPKPKKPKRTRAAYNAERAAKKKIRDAAIAKRRADAKKKRDEAKKKKLALKPKPKVKPVKKPIAAKPKKPAVAKPVKPVDPAKAAERQAAAEDRKKRRADADARRADSDKRRAIADERRAARDAERAKPKPEKEPAKGGGGGGGGDKKSDAKSPADQRAKDLTDKLSAGEPLTPDEEDELIRNGFAKRGADGKLALTSAGQGKRKEAPELTVFKDANGRYRWVLRTTTAFLDRDEEIISTKAIEQDCDRADADGDYGPLRWWHIPGLDIGDCDFNMLYGRTLIESGTFRDERLGPIIAAKSADLESSPGFLHPPTEPVEGVYHTIRRFERSLVPRGFASNLFTGLTVVQEKDMLGKLEKIKAFFELSADKEVMQAVLNQAQMTEKSAEGQGVAYKAAGDEEALAAEDAAEEMVEDEEVAVAEFIGDMTPDEFRAMMTEIMSSVMTGASAETTKAANEATAVAQAAIKSIALKQAEDDKARAAEIAKLKARLNELEGDQPRALQARRASQSDATITTDETLKVARHQAESTDDFGKFLFSGFEQR